MKKKNKRVKGAFDNSHEPVTGNHCKDDEQVEIKQMLRQIHTAQNKNKLQNKSSIDIQRLKL